MGNIVALITMAGTTVGVAPQLSLAIAGLGWLISIAAGLLAWIKWPGVIYPLYLAQAGWLQAATDLAQIAAGHLATFSKK